MRQAHVRLLAILCLPSRHAVRVDGQRLLRRQRRETAPARHKGPGKTSDRASATSLPPAVRAKSASGRGLRAHARGAGQVRGKRDKGHLFGTESGPRRPVFWVSRGRRIKVKEQRPPGGRRDRSGVASAPHACARRETFLQDYFRDWRSGGGLILTQVSMKKSVNC